jgi:hypothetical protein
MSQVDMKEIESESKGTKRKREREGESKDKSREEEERRERLLTVAESHLWKTFSVTSPSSFQTK